MKKFLVMVVCFLLAGGWSFGNLRAACGAGIFKQYKCVKCHTFKKYGITKVVKEEADEDEDEEELGEDEKPPDLTEKRSAKFLKAAGGDPKGFVKKFLHQETRIGTKKHKKRFKGSEADLNTIIECVLGS